MRDMDPTPAGVVERRGCPIHYWSYGPTDAPAVVLTHGVTIDHRTWHAQVPALRDAGYRVITWDLRGHGLSRPTGASFSVPEAIDDLNAVLDDAGVDEAMHVGQSFGGFLVQEFYRAHRARVTGLVLVGAHVVGDPLPRHQQMVQRLRPTILRWWPEGHLRKVIPLFLSRDEEVRRYVARATQALSKDDFIHVTRAALEPLLGAAPLKLPELPVMIVYGEAEMRMIRKMIRNRQASDAAIEVEVVPGGGHLINQERPGGFSEALLAFLQQHVPITVEPDTE